MHSRMVPPLSLGPIPSRDVLGILKVFENEPDLPELLRLWRYNVDHSPKGPYGKVPIMQMKDHQTSKDMTMAEIKILTGNLQLAPHHMGQSKSGGRDVQEPRGKGE